MQLRVYFILFATGTGAKMGKRKSVDLSEDRKVYRSELK